MYLNQKKKGIGKRLATLLLFISVFISSLWVQKLYASAENKSKYFVEIGDKVYFRKFGKNALPKTMIWYDYLTEPTWKKGSFVAVYDKKTKKVSKAFDDDGSVLYYADNRFYTQYKNKVYSVDKKGKNYKKISDNGSLKGVFNKNYIVVNEKDKSKIYKKGKKIGIKTEFRINGRSLCDLF